MKIGSTRVSKQEQQEMLQIDALKDAGCAKWFLDKMTGAKADAKAWTREALVYRSQEIRSSCGSWIGQGTLIDLSD